VGTTGAIRRTKFSTQDLEEAVRRSDFNAASRRCLQQVWGLTIRIHIGKYQAP
jgi:hypothetical protein